MSPQIRSSHPIRLSCYNDRVKMILVFTRMILRCRILYTDTPNLWAEFAGHRGDALITNGKNRKTLITHKAQIVDRESIASLAFIVPSIECDLHFLALRDVAQKLPLPHLMDQLPLLRVCRKRNRTSHCCFPLMTFIAKFVFLK